MGLGESIVLNKNVGHQVQTVKSIIMDPMVWPKRCPGRSHCSPRRIWRFLKGSPLPAFRSCRSPRSHWYEPYGMGVYTWHWLIRIANECRSKQFGWVMNLFNIAISKTCFLWLHLLSTKVASIMRLLQSQSTTAAFYVPYSDNETVQNIENKTGLKLKAILFWNRDHECNTSDKLGMKKRINEYYCIQC